MLLLTWKELTNHLAGGRLLSTAAHACLKLERSSSKTTKGHWIGNGLLFSAWLGRNVADMASHCAVDDVGTKKAAVDFLGKAMSLGYTGTLGPMTASDRR
jgi:hypothetical protein